MRRRLDAGDDVDVSMKEMLAEEVHPPCGMLAEEVCHSLQPDVPRDEMIFPPCSFGGHVSCHVHIFSPFASHHINPFFNSYKPSWMPCQVTDAVLKTWHPQGAPPNSTGLLKPVHKSYRTLLEGAKPAKQAGLG